MSGQAGTERAEQLAAGFAQMRDVLIEGGWIQGALRTSEGHCLFGVAHVGRTQAQAYALIEALRRYLHATDPAADEAAGVVRWNDAPGRAAGEVTAMLERAAVWIKENPNG